jgi:hypothetical protein
MPSTAQGRKPWQSASVAQAARSVPSGAPPARAEGRGSRPLAMAKPISASRMSLSVFSVSWRARMSCWVSQRNHQAGDQQRHDHQHHRHFGEGEAAGKSRSARDGGHSSHVVNEFMMDTVWSLTEVRWPMVKPGRALRKE